MLSAGVLAMVAAGAPVALAHGERKLVRYRDYKISVPASWPVIDLARDPHACVRFDRHAVYLGEPGAWERCPARAVGRSEAILVSPLSAGVAGAGASEAVTLPSGPGAVAFPARGVAVTATWGSHPDLVRRALGVRSLRSLRARSVATSGSASFSPSSSRTRRPIAHASAVYTGLGFDACAAPNTSQMAAWGSSPYRAVGVYIGGANRACAQQNLTPSWVSTESSAGWHLIPIYVGLQGRSACSCAAIDPGTASAEGAAAASDAMNGARALGIGPGNPIYDDMEGGYSRDTTTISAVLAFLSSWTATLHGAGYGSGVYSSADSGVRDLAAQWGTGYTEPDDIWFARWNDVQSTSDSSLPANTWAAHQRLHQYSGAHNATYGGATINIDGDYLDGATAGASATPSAFSDGSFVQVAGVFGVYRIAGGAPLYVNDPSLLAGATILTITQEQLDALPAVPADGTFVETTTGAFYRIAGGAPLLVSDWTPFGGARPSVLIDQWDLDNITNPQAHLNPVPANGTFLTSTSGRTYRVAGGAPFSIHSWSVFGRPQPSVTVDQWNIDNIANPASHLYARPVDGTVIEGLPSHWYWSFAGGWRQQASATPQAIKVDDAGVPAFPSLHPLPIPQCIAPGLRHLTFPNARRAITKALCTLGKVHRPRHWGRHHRLRVYWQIPHARKAFPEGHRVGIRMR